MTILEAADINGVKQLPPQANVQQILDIITKQLEILDRLTKEKLLVQAGVKVVERK